MVIEINIHQMTNIVSNLLVMLIRSLSLYEKLKPYTSMQDLIQVLYSEN